MRLYKLLHSNYRKMAFSLIFLFPILSKAQLTQPQLDSLISSFTTNLKKKKIDTILTYKQFCIGCLFQPVKDGNLCLENFASLPTYVFWKEKGKTFATRKDICFDYSVQEIAHDSIWTYYLANQPKIRKEELKEPQYEETVNGKKVIRTVNIEHSIFFHLTIGMAGNNLFKEINSFYFTPFLGPDETVNLNYQYNISTALSNLHMIIQRIIKSEPVKQQFVRTLR